MANPGKRVSTGEEQGIVGGPTQERPTSVHSGTVKMMYSKGGHILTCVCGVGLMQGKTVMANPGRRVLTGEDLL